ncbi:ABC transporter substrate-binding protein [Streptomyces sp. NPDC088925]|uniref:ABC transporter substrate-binding protein n=1 Tax=Streptomyces sp. NPDC088925 TaxID=3365914 RepID=UPI0037FFC98A
MRRRTVLGAAAAVASTGLLSSCGSGDDDGRPTLDFLSLAWQAESVAANKALVAEWNRSRPAVRVRYVQGSWTNVHDQLLTSFAGDAAPDIIHDEANDLTDFGHGGDLADLSDLLPADLRARIPADSWDTARFRGGLYGVPFLQEPRVLIANRALLAGAGIAAPTAAHPWTWDEFEDAARELTRHEKGRESRYGVVWAMKEPVNQTVNMAVTTGGRIIHREDGRTRVRFDAADSAVAELIRRQVRDERTAPASGLGMGGGDTLPGFFAGRYAMVPLGFSYRQQVGQQAPKGFDWVTLPLPVGRGAPDGGRAQGVSPQTLSVSRACRHKEAAVAFLAFLTRTAALTRLARGDWLLPTGTASLRDPSLNTGENGWRTGARVARHLVASPALGARGYPEWMDKIATPALQQYYSGAIGLDTLRTRLVRDGNRVFDRYRD